MEGFLQEAKIYTFVDLFLNPDRECSGLGLTGAALWILGIAITVISILLAIHHDEVVQVLASTVDIERMETYIDRI